MKTREVVQLPPNLVSAIDLQIGPPDAFNLGHQHLVTPHTRTALFGLTAQGRVTPVTGRGDLQLAADRLDPECIAMRVDE